MLFCFIRFVILCLFDILIFFLLHLYILKVVENTFFSLSPVVSSQSVGFFRISFEVEKSNSVIFGCRNLMRSLLTSVSFIF